MAKLLKMIVNLAVLAALGWAALKEREMAIEKNCN